MKTLSSKVRVTLYLFAYCGIVAIGIFGMCSFAHAAGAKWVSLFDWSDQNEFGYVDHDTCIGCGNCVEASPVAFYLGGDEKAHIWNDAGREEIGEGMDACPVEAVHFR